MNKQGALIISLDFEMMWGCHDWASSDGYGHTNVKQVREVIGQLLQLFKRYDIHATIAFVGLLLQEDVKAAQKNMPNHTPSYTNPQLSPFRDDLFNSITSANSDIYFAKDIISLLKTEPNIELASHTYSHFFCSEPGQTFDEFKADLCKMDEISKANEIDIKTIVFPKNQINDKYLYACKEMGMTAFRGNASHFYSDEGIISRHINRILRYVDSYFRLSNTSYSIKEVKSEGGLINVPASRFLRPYNSRFAFLEPLKLRRIKKELLYAARHGKIYQIWWHPHNFGSHIQENLKILENVLKYYQELNRIYGMRSYTIGELANSLEQKR